MPAAALSHIPLHTSPPTIGIVGGRIQMSKLDQTKEKKALTAFVNKIYS